MTFVKVYGFTSFTKNMGKNISMNLSGKYSQNLLDDAKKSATDALKTASINQLKKQLKQLAIYLLIKLLTW